MGSSPTPGNFSFKEKVYLQDQADQVVTYPVGHPLTHRKTLGDVSIASLRRAVRNPR